MGHLTTRDAYKNLEDRINWFTQGAPASESLTKILQLLMIINKEQEMNRRFDREGGSDGYTG